jgi:hypothetical protein
MRYTAFGLLTVAAIVLPLGGCGGGASTLTPPSHVASPTPSPTPTANGALTAATSTTCVAPLASTQTVTLPTTGGVTATLSFGAFPAGLTGCLNVTIATGADAEQTTALRSAAQRRAMATVPPGAITSLTFAEAFPGSGNFLTTAVVGATLQSRDSVNFPDGQYTALIVTPAGDVSVCTFTGKNGTLVLTSPTVIQLDAQSVLYLYPAGVNPDATPTPTATPMVTPTPIGSATPEPSPTATIPGQQTFLDEENVVPGCVTFASGATAQECNGLQMITFVGTSTDFTLTEDLVYASGEQLQMYDWSVPAIKSEESAPGGAFSIQYSGAGVADGIDSEYTAVSTGPVAQPGCNGNSQINNCLVYVYFDNAAREAAFHTAFAAYESEYGF